MSVAQLARRSRPPEGLPCCTLVALALLEGEGNEITSVDDGVRVGGLDWWSRANVWSPDAPWSALDAARELTGGTDARILLVRDVAPPLRPGRWHVVQRWRHLGDGGAPGVADDTVVPGKSTGHTYVAWMGEDRRVRIVQSSTARGYRDTWGTWEGDAGLSGYAVGVVYLPTGWTWGA